MKKTTFMLVIVTCVLLISGCQSGQRKTPEKLPGIELSLSEMNVEMQLIAPPEANSFEIGDNIRLIAVNLSEIPILLSQDYGVKVFFYQNDQWLPIENDFGYPAGETLLLPKEQQLFGGTPVVLHPSLLDEQPVEIRIIVIGKMQDSSSSNKQVGAFIDVSLKR